MKKNFLILGSNGSLGKKVLKILSLKKNYQFKTVAKKNADFNFNLENITKLEKIIKNYDFNYVINCAAYTNLQYCEKNYNKILKINTKLPTKLSKWSSKYHFRYIHISTDHIYVSKNKNYNSENSKIGWHNKYSKSKYLAEKNLINKSRVLIIRTNFVDNRRNKKSFLNWLHHHIKNKKKIPLFFDMYTSTIDLETFVKILITLTVTNSFGIFNIGSNQILSKKEFALKYFKKLKIQPSYMDVKTNNSQEISFKRGRYLGLKIEKVEKRLKIKMPNSNKVINNLFYENIRN